MLILYTLRTRARHWCMHWAYASGIDAYVFRNWCVHWAYASGIDAYVSILFRNWCVHWAYATGTNACTEHSPFKICWAYASGTDVYLVNTGQKLMRTLCLRVRNWCVPWAHGLGTDAYPKHMHHFLSRTLILLQKKLRYKQLNNEQIFLICMY